MTLLDLFRVLSSFEPPRGPIKDAPWEAYATWALGNGLAPLAAYNLEYRLAGGGAPEAVRDRLLSLYQGTVNDNVMKLVNFKRSIDSLEGRKVVLLGGASFADSLYPHVAFRPVIEIDLLLRGADVTGFSGFMKQAHFTPLPKERLTRSDVAAVLTDTRTELILHSSLFGGPTTPIDEEVMDRALPLKVYGPSVFRLSHEDAILHTCLTQAQAGYQLPLLSFVDLRELLLGAPFMGGDYSHPPNAELVRARARQWGLERALYASLSICERLYPQTAEVAAKMKPELKGTSKKLVDRVVVQPLSELSTRTMRGADRVRRWLTGRS